MPSVLILLLLNNNVCLYFLSFEAGITDAISSFKWQKIIFMEKKHIRNVIIWSTEHEH